MDLTQISAPGRRSACACKTDAHAAVSNSATTVSERETPSKGRCQLLQEGLVSVVVPALRADRFVGGLLASVRDQTYREWELIVVEDGSAGTTESQVRAFAAEIGADRVRYVRHEVNRGQAAARNTAVDLARGEFLAFLDADDGWLPGHLEAAVTALHDAPADLAYSTVVRFEDQSGLPLGLWGPGSRDLDRFPGSLAWRNFVTPSSVVVRRRIWAQVGPFDVDPQIQACEDLDYWLRCVAAGLRFVHVPGRHCLYRKGNSDSETADRARIAERHARVLSRCRRWQNLPLQTMRRAEVFYRTAAGVLQLGDDPRSAASNFRGAWRMSPVRLDLLAAAGVASTAIWVPPVRWCIGRLVRRLDSWRQG